MATVTKEQLRRSTDDNYILNPVTSKYVDKTSSIGLKLLEEQRRSTDDKYILHPLKNKYILKTSKIGQIILVGNTSLDEKNRPPRLVCQDETGVLSISVRGKQGEWLLFRLQHFVDGIKRLKSVLLEFQPENAGIINKTCMTLLVAMCILKRKGKYATLGLVQDIKSTILEDKSNFSDIYTLLTLLLPMLGRVLIGKEKVLIHYWNKSYQALSKKLWLPTVIDSLDRPLNSSNESVKSVDDKSWFTIETRTKPKNSEWSTMSSKSCMSTLVDSMGNDDVGLQPQPQESTRKIRIFPNEQTKKAFRLWIASACCIYNKVVYYNHKTSSFYELREKFVNENIVTREVVDDGIVRTGRNKLNGKIVSKVKNPDVNEWCLNAPKDVRSGAVYDYVTARKAAITNLNQGNIKYFKMQYRKSGDKRYPSIAIENSKSLQNGKYIQFYPEVLKKMTGKKDNKILVSKADRAFLHNVKMRTLRLKYEYRKWFLCVPYLKPVEDQLQAGEGMCGIDPGVRVPFTLYTGNKIVRYKHDRQLQEKLQRRLDLFQSLKDKKTIRFRSFSRRRKRLKNRWESLRKDMHYKIAKDMISENKIIGLPPFNTSEMVQLKLASKTKREMLGLGHFQFKQRLISKARGHTHVLSVDESYTTQTCTQCGHLKYMGGLEIYKCGNKECNLVIGRDDGSARSIFMCTMNRRFL